MCLESDNYHLTALCAGLHDVLTIDISGLVAFCKHEQAASERENVWSTAGIFGCWYCSVSATVQHLVLFK